jgi:glyoxylase-like metal-dependent hydrolase (beta-lactamase superfamily II)
VEKEEKNLADEQAQFDEYKTIKILDPVQTFEKSYTIVLGGDTIDLIYPGPGHTSCNLVVYFRAQKIVHTGDLMFEGSCGCPKSNKYFL